MKDKILLNKDRMDQFFENAASGFDISIFEVIAILLMLLVLIYGLIRLHRRNVKRTRHRNKQLSTKIFSQQLKGLDLLPSEKAALVELASYLPEPEHAYRLLRDESTFWSAQSQIIQNRHPLARQTIVLQLKLNIKERSNLLTTADVSVNDVILCRDFIFKIVDKTYKGLHVTGFNPDIRKGQILKCLIRRSSGLYTFSGQVLHTSDAESILAHSTIVRFTFRLYKRMSP